MTRHCLVAFLLSASSAAIADEPFMQHQVLVRAGQDGYGGYRIPCVLTTSKPGTVLVFAEARQALDGFGVPFPDHAVTEIVMRRSTDHGRTWSKQRVVAESGDVTTGSRHTSLSRKHVTPWLASTTQSPVSPFFYSLAALAFRPNQIRPLKLSGQNRSHSWEC